MNTQTALDELASDLENSIAEVKNDRDYWKSEGLNNSSSFYERKLNLYRQAINKVREIKSLLAAIERGF